MSKAKKHKKHKQNQQKNNPTTKGPNQPVHHGTKEKEEQNNNTHTTAVSNNQNVNDPLHQNSSKLHLDKKEPDARHAKKITKKEHEKKARSHPSAIQQMADVLVVFLSVVLVIGGLLYVGMNIAYSQQVESLYFRFITEDKEASYDFLRQMKDTPHYAEVQERLPETLDEMQGRIVADEQETQAEIASMEAILEQNPKARDILYALHTLYIEMGEEGKAAEYLHRAQAVDPKIQ